MTYTIQSVKCECGLHPVHSRTQGVKWETSVGCYACGVVIVTDDDMPKAVTIWNRVQAGLMALAAIPDPGKILRERLLRLITTRGEVSEGVLLNLVRPISWDSMTHELVELMKSGEVKATLRENPRNKKSHTIYSIRH